MESCAKALTSDDAFSLLLCAVLLAIHFSSVPAAEGSEGSSCPQGPGEQARIRSRQAHPREGPGVRFAAAEGADGGEVRLGDWLSLRWGIFVFEKEKGVQVFCM